MSAAPRPLGSAPFAVSPLALGTWRTFERIGRERAVEIVRAAAAGGINFFDDADVIYAVTLPAGLGRLNFVGSDRTARSKVI